MSTLACIKTLNVWILCKNCDLRISKCLCHFDMLQKKKNRQEVLDDDVEERRNASEL